MSWTDLDVRRLIGWSKDYVPVAEIAARLGKTYGQVVTRRGKFRREGKLTRLGYAGLEIFEAAYRALARTAHPDRGGTDEAWKTLDTAITMIRKERGK